MSLLGASSATNGNYLGDRTVRYIWGFLSFHPLLNQPFDFSHESTMKRPSNLPIVPFAWHS